MYGVKVYKSLWNLTLILIKIDICHTSSENGNLLKWVRKNICILRHKKDIIKIFMKM